MTLEDFFTLTEMKDGFATLARIEELLSVMQKQKDFVMTNVGDAARQWSTVASILAATENKDCLNHFIQLDGLCFLNQWLQAAQKWSDDASELYVEELLNAILGVLDRLPVDPERSSAAGIGITVKQLLGHRSHNVQERARTLFDKWNQVKHNDSKCQNIEEQGTCSNDEPKPSAETSMAEEGLQSTYPVLDVSPSEKGPDEGSREVESAVSDSLQSNAKRCSDGYQSDTVKDANISISNQSTTHADLNSADAKVVSGDMNSFGSSLVSNPRQESLSIAVESICPAAEVAASTCSSPISRGRNVDDCSDVSNIKDISDGPKEMEIEVNTKELSQCKSSQKEMCSVSSPSLLTVSPVHVQNSEAEPPVPCDFDSKGSQSCIANTSEPQPKGGTVDCGMPKYSRITKELKPVGQAAKSFQDLSSSGHTRRKLVASKTSYKKDGLGIASDTKEVGSDPNLKNRVDSMISSALLKPTVDTSAVSDMDRRSEMGLEYGEIDALEVARQVAIEVEREVVDYREPFCSSSPEGNSQGGFMESSSSDLEENKREKPVTKQLNVHESPTRKDLSDDSSPKENSSRVSENIDIVLKDSGQKPESPKSTSVQVSVGNNDKSRCDFDLNEDVCPEETDSPMVLAPNQVINLTAPIAVPASKGAPGLPGTPLHFEGELGWRGSAATSAFRPASPRRTPDGEKTVSGPTQKPNILQIDLNVAEGEDNVAIDPVLDKKIPVSSGPPSVDSSMEVSSRRAERLKFDLNRLGDEETLPNQSSYWRLRHQNGNRSPSPASSSSSRQPSMRDIDLNDNPSFFDACGSSTLIKSSSNDTSIYGSHRLDDPVITIGSIMSVERKELVNQTHQFFLGNGLSMDSTMGGTRASVPYPPMPPPGYGYHGPAMSFPPAFYGPGSIPYMVDSRGPMVIPQMLGSSAGLNGAPSSARPPFLMSVAGAPAGLNAVAVWQPNLDLNSGTAPTEGGSRESGRFKQLLIQGNNGLMEDQVRSASQPTASGMALKRKEPDSGWEPCTFGYEHVTTSWQ